VEGLEQKQWIIFAKIAQALPLHETLSSIVTLIEEWQPEALGSILLYDRNAQVVRHGASSRLPATFVEAIDGASVGPEEGSCGAAAFLGTPVIAVDIATHPNWRNYRALALPLGLRSCWSTPIRAPDGEVLGTFALYYREPHDPTADDEACIAFATHAASIALVRHRADSALRESERRARQSARLYAVSSAVNEAIARISDPGELYRTACQIAVDKGLSRLAWAGKLNTESGRLEVVARFGEDEGYVDAVAARLLEGEARHGPAARALATGLPAIENDVANSKHFMFRLEAAARGIASAAVFPLTMGDERGVLCIYGDRPDFFLEEEVRVLSALADDLAFAVRSAQQDQERTTVLAALGERVKELTTLHKVARLLQSSERIDEVVLNRLVATIPSAFQYPEATGASLIYGVWRAQTPAFSPGQTLLTERFEVDGEQGSLTVSSEHDGRPGPAFLPEEEDLLRSLVDMLRSRLHRDRAETKLNEGRRLVSIASHLAKVGGFQLDSVTGEMICSEELLSLLGLHEGSVGSLLDALYPEPSAARERLSSSLREALSLGTPLDQELVLTRGSARPRHLRLVVQPVLDPTGKTSRIQGALQDITESRRLEDQFRQAQKMEAVGRLAGGVAHDFNNLLSVILGYVHLALESHGPGPLREDLEQIQSASNRAAALTRQLLAFSRHQVLAPRIIDLARVLKDLEPMLTRLVGEDVTVGVVRGDSVGPILADAGQMEQVLMNLAVNARDAMPRGGYLTLEAANAEISPEYALEHEGVTPGQYVRLAVSDTGTGMDRDTQTRIFEPFFTTKEEGKGTGLGLSTVWGIVSQSGGHIDVYSEVGHGTTFKVYFPRVEQVPEVKRASKSPERLTRGTETVLLVEDEKQLRTLTAFLLRRSGYQVLEANDGEEALLMAKHFSSPIHLLITDVVMPKMGGVELAQKVSAARPDMQVLFMSGYTEDAIVRHGALDPTSNFLAKPLTPDTFLPRVRALLDGTANSIDAPTPPGARPRDAN